jgi:PAS domain S-box-containing protein
MSVSLSPLPVFTADACLLRRLRVLTIGCWFAAVVILCLSIGAWKCPPSWPGVLLGRTEMMRPVTAVALVLGALGLGVVLFARTTRTRLYTRIIGGALTATALVAFVERLLGHEHGLSRLAFRLISAVPPPGFTPWMAPNAGLCFMLIGSAFLCLPTKDARSSAASQWLGIAALATATLALLGYVYGVQPLFLIGLHTPMAVPSALAISALAIGVIGAETTGGPVAMLLAPNLGGYALRRLLPAVILIPPSIGWLILLGREAGFYEQEFGTAVFAAANVFVFTGLIICVTRQVIRLERELKHQREINRTILETAPAALFLLDAQNRITLANREVEPLFGWKPDELQLQPLQTRLRPVPGDEKQGEELAVLKAAREGRALRDHEEVFYAKDGRAIDVLCATTPLHTEAGSHRSILLAVDITGLKQAQRAQRRSEERFAIISRITNDAIWDWDLTTDLIWWNQSIEKIAGIDPNELPQTIVSWEQHIHPDDRERVVSSINKVIESGGREWTAEYRYRRHDGEDRFMLDRGCVIRDEGGRPIRMLGGMTDITERKQAEESLHIAVRRFETLANLIPQFVWSARPDGYHDFFNERWYEFTGMPRNGDQGWNWKDYLHPDDFETTIAVWNHCLQTGEPYQIEYRFRRARDGAYVWFIGRALPIRDPEGRISRWFGTCTDIDDQRRAGERLEALVHQRTAQLRESVSDLEHFSYTLTHDMRAPLRAMQGYAHILMEEHASQIDPEGSDYLRRIMSAADRMDHLILDALNYSKVVKAELTLTPVETGPLLRGLIESYPEFQSPHAEVFLLEPLPVVWGNVSGLTQCFSNLLVNAVKFVKAGERPRVRVWAEERGERVCLWFEDNGIGIPAQHRERVFQMFERLNPSYEGTGVGLALVRKVTERMRGHVGVEPGVNGGSRFWIELLKG